jgi:hypothetical protein
LQRGISKSFYIPLKKDRAGILNGIFLGIYNLNGILGSIITISLVSYLDIFTIIWILFGLACVSWILFWFIPYPSKDSWSLIWNRGIAESLSLKLHFAKLGKTITDRKLLLIIPAMIQCSIYITFTYGILPLLVKLHLNGDPTIIQSQNFIVSGIFLWYGCTAGVFSVLWGKITDIFGNFWVLVSQVILTFAQQLYICLWLFDCIPLGAWWQWWCIAIVSGMLDTNAVTTINILLNTFHNDHVFAWYRFSYCTGITVFSIINVYLSLKTMPFIIFFWCLISTFCVVQVSD